ncbi:MAG: hypothetical protein HYY06_04280 [Deltaproteobacteria bacterium]|nr:hypothetical protein [Deltaproteobacteria bacterium]
MSRACSTLALAVVVAIVAASCSTSVVSRPWRHGPPKAERRGPSPADRIALSPAGLDRSRVSRDRGERPIGRRATETRPEGRAAGPAGGRAARSVLATLGKDALDKVLRDRLGAIASCYGEGERLPESLDIALAADGSLGPATADMPPCVARVLRSARLPSAAGGRVNYAMPPGWAAPFAWRIAP